MTFKSKVGLTGSLALVCVLGMGGILSLAQESSGSSQDNTNMNSNKKGRNKNKNKNTGGDNSNMESPTNSNVP